LQFDKLTLPHIRIVERQLRASEWVEINRGAKADIKLARRLKI
jgi:hypothetical protein